MRLLCKHYNDYINKQVTRLTPRHFDAERMRARFPDMDSAHTRAQQGPEDRVLPTHEPCSCLWCPSHCMPWRVE